MNEREKEGKKARNRRKTKEKEEREIEEMGETKLKRNQIFTQRSVQVTIESTFENKTISFYVFQKRGKKKGMEECAPSPPTMLMMNGNLSRYY